MTSALVRVSNRSISAMDWHRSHRLKRSVKPHCRPIARPITGRVDDQTTSRLPQCRVREDRCSTRSSELVVFNTRPERPRIPILRPAHCLRRVAHRAIRRAQSPMRLAQSPMREAHCLMYIAHCLMRGAHCPMRAAHRALRKAKKRFPRTPCTAYRLALSRKLNLPYHLEARDLIHRNPLRDASEYLSPSSPGCAACLVCCVRFLFQRLSRVRTVCTCGILLLWRSEARR